jgi:flotillin
LIIKAQAQLALAEADKKEKELLATVVKPAEAERTAAIARAEGEREAAIKTAEAEQKKLTLEGEGRAAAILAQGRAEAEIIQLKLEAEASGILQKAEAYAKLQEAGMTLQVLEQLRLIIPEALRELAPVMAEIAKPLGSVDRISLVDFGGGDGVNNSGSVARFAQIVPTILLQLFEGMRAAGFDPTDLANLLHVGESNSDKPA